MSISDNIRRLRIVNNLTQQELADAIFVTRTAIANYESGRRIPDIDTLKAIAKVLKVSISDITNEDLDINYIRNIISNTDVLDKRKHRTFGAPIMNIILTVALLISIATVLIPAIKQKHLLSYTKDLKIENIQQIDMVLSNGYLTKNFSFKKDEDNTIYFINTFDISNTNLINKHYNKQIIKFYLSNCFCTFF